MRPSRTLTRGNTSGYKKEKARVTLLLACNAIGTEKLPPLFIHYHETPRILKNLNKKGFQYGTIEIILHGCRLVFIVFKLKKII